MIPLYSKKPQKSTQKAHGLKAEEVPGNLPGTSCSNSI